MIAQGTAYQDGPNFARDPASMLAFYDGILRLRDLLRTADAPISLEVIASWIETSFDLSVADLADDTDFQATVMRVFDSIIAIFLDPSRYRYLLPTLVEIAQVLSVILRADGEDTLLSSLTAVNEVLSFSILLPDTIFPLRPDQIRPVGVADLLVVKQQLMDHELADIADIENVLRGESRKHTKKHSLVNDETRVTEREKTEETTKELSTTDRFELKREVETTLKEDHDVHAGLSVTSKYGEMLEIGAKVDYDYKLSKSESDKLAQTQAKDVTQRAASKVTERFREEVTTRIVETFEETEERGFENASGGSNISGVYQFVNKVYKAQVFNYGKRLLFDLIVPEPAAFYLDALAGDQRSTAPKKPDLFDLGPHQIEWDNPNSPVYYLKLAAKYGARGLKDRPGPASYTIERAINGQGNGDKELTESTEISIPDGYVATGGTFRVTLNASDNDHHDVKVVTGGAYLFFSHADAANNYDDAGRIVGTVTYNNAKSVGIGIVGWHINEYTINVVITCVLEGRAIEEWKFNSYDSILASYQEQLKAYEEKIAAQSFQERFNGSAGGAANPDLNRRIEQTELKKSCIALLSGVNLMSFDGIDEDDPPSGDPTPGSPPPRSFPRPKPAAVVQMQARIIRFFEQAFEWEQVMYIFYPYFWARKSAWYDGVLRDHDDPLFAEFLKAGSARVVLPVRPSFEADIRYFLLTGEIWSGAGMPDVTDKNYLPITEEIKERSGASSGETPQGDPWLVKVPTKLVKLRSDGALPKWQQLDPSVWEWYPLPEGYS